jgi:hypothetical protein
MQCLNDDVSFLYCSGHLLYSFGRSLILCFCMETEHLQCIGVSGKHGLIWYEDSVFCVIVTISIHLHILCCSKMQFNETNPAGNVTSSDIYLRYVCHMLNCG